MKAKKVGTFFFFRAAEKFFSSHLFSFFSRLFPPVSYRWGRSALPVPVGKPFVPGAFC
jgi:hypothetical protein